METVVQVVSTQGPRPTFVITSSESVFSSLESRREINSCNSLLLFVGGEGGRGGETRLIGRFMGGEGNLCGTERRKEIENNDRIKYKFAPLVQYIPSLDRYIFIFRNLYWTNLARLTILKCGKSGREMGTCCPLIRFSQFCLLNGPRMTRNKFYVDVPSDIFALKVSSSPFHLDFYEVDATRSPIRYVFDRALRKWPLKW